MQAPIRRCLHRAIGLDFLVTRHYSRPMTLRRWVVVRCRTDHSVFSSNVQEIGPVARCFTRRGANRLARLLYMDEAHWTTSYRVRRRKAAE